MASLRHLFSHLRQAAGSKAISTPNRPAKDRRLLPERRRTVRAQYNHEMRIRCAAQAVGFGIYELDCSDGQFHWSPELKGIAGLSQGDGPLSMKQMEERIHPDDRVRVLNEFQAALDPHGTGAFNDEYRLLRPDGTVIWVKATGRTFFSGEGRDRRPLGTTGVIMDISERKLADAVVALREKHFDQAVRGAAIGIWNWDLRTNEITWSERCRELFGIPGGEPMSLDRFLEALHPDDREQATVALQEAWEHHRDYHVEYRILWPDGTFHWIEALGSAFSDEKGGAAVRMAGIALDVTERKLQEKMLLDSNEQLASRAKQDRVQLGEAQDALESTNLELRQFAYIAAHDMQTPLRSITGFAQLLQKEYRGRPLDAQAELWLNRLVSAALRMHELIQDLLTYSGVASLGRPFEATDMNLVFDEVVASFEPVIRESNATITRDELPTVIGDRLQLATLLQNLIENGIKFHGSDPPRGHVSARREGKQWVFSVRDNGIGIAGKHHEQIFDIFRQLHGQQAYAGTGIGLAISRRVVQRHGGRIWVESEPGHGSTFFFTLTCSPI